MGKSRQRLCLVSREMVSEPSLIRYVCDTDHQLIADLAAKLPGRGAWVTADRGMTETAIQKNLFSRAFKQQVSVSKDFVNQIENLLEKKCLSLLGLAFRGGYLSCGFESVKKQIRIEEPAYFIQAKDASRNAQEKVEFWQKMSGKTLTIINRFSSRQLGAALGMESLIYLTVKKGRMAERFALEWQRLKAFQKEKNL